MPKKGYVSNRRFPDKLGKSIALRFEEIGSSKQVAVEFGCSASSVINMAHRYGVTVIPSGTPLPRFTVEHKVCRDCQEDKEANLFLKDPERLDGIQIRCKDCEYKRRETKDPNWREVHRLKMKESRRKNPRKAREKGLQRRFGITVEQFEDLFNCQERKCPGCGIKEPIDKRSFWHVDHDHKCCNTPETCGNCIRGILCRSCNSALGLLRDSPETLRALAKYLENRSVYG